MSWWGGNPSYTVNFVEGGKFNKQSTEGWVAFLLFRDLILILQKVSLEKKMFGHLFLKLIADLYNFLKKLRI